MSNSGDVEHQEVHEKFNAVFIRLAELDLKLIHYEKETDLKVGHVGSLVESERGTLKRQGEGIRAEIKIIKDDLQAMMYDQDKGILVTLDRLKNESSDRKHAHQNLTGLVIGLAVATFSLLLKVGYDLITVK